MVNKTLGRFVATLQFIIIATLILRLFFAYEWLNSGIGKWKEITKDSQAYFGKMQTVLSKAWTEGSQTVKPNPYPLMVNFLKNVAAPNTALFITLVALAEVSVGVSYLFGFLVRPAALVGMFLSLVIYFAAGHTSAAVAGVNLIMFGGQLFLFLVSAGRAYGLDAVLNKKLRKPNIF